MVKTIENILLYVLVTALVIVSGFTVNYYYNEKLEEQHYKIENLNVIINQQETKIENIAVEFEQEILQYEEIYKELRRDNIKLENDIDDAEDEIEDLERDMINPEEAKVLGKLVSGELGSIISSYNIEARIIFGSDVNYSLTSVEEAKRFNKETKVKNNFYFSEQFDCDEFAAALYGYWNHDRKQFAFGLAWSSTHAFNVMIDENKELWVVEPQENRFIRYSDDIDEKYKITRFVII